MCPGLKDWAAGRMMAGQSKGSPKGPRKLFRNLIPRRNYAVCRAVVSAVTVMLVTQQLLFMRTEDIQTGYTPADQSGVGLSTTYLAGRGGIMRTTNKNHLVDQARAALGVVEEPAEEQEQERSRREETQTQDDALRIPGIHQHTGPGPGGAKRLAFVPPERIAEKRLQHSKGGAGRRPEERRLGRLARKLKELTVNARWFAVIAEEYHDDAMAFEIHRELGLSQSLIEEAKSLLEEQQGLGQRRGEDAGGVAPARLQERVDALESVLARAREKPHDTSALVYRLRTRLETAESQMRHVNQQSKLFSQMAAKAVPQSLHCLAMRLTMEHARTALQQQQQQPQAKKEPPASKLHNRGLYHYALFSDNVLAVAVVVNSTAQHLRQERARQLHVAAPVGDGEESVSDKLLPWKHVFHVVTDRMNFGAMQAWFALHPPQGVTLEVRCLDDYPWINASYVPVLAQIESLEARNYYFKFPAPDAEVSEKDDFTNLKYRNPKYMSILNHLRFYLPEIFPELDKVLFMDDDVVVQRDLSPLWELPMNGKVNLAVETCGKVFHRFRTYLNFSSELIAGKFDPEACGWAFGLNMFDLNAWRRGNFTEAYHYWQRQNENRTLWKLGTLPAGLLTFYNATEPLDRSWLLIGLGSTASVDLDAIPRAAVLHYNGHAKPWSELAIARYQRFWGQYVPYDSEVLQACNVTPR
eukprot:jgi/Mesen1/10866/ME000093S10381